MKINYKIKEYSPIDMYMKEGERILCISTKRMELSGEIYCTQGKIYIIRKVEDRYKSLVITDDQGENNHITMSNKAFVKYGN